MSSIVAGILADEPGRWITAGDNFFVDSELSVDALSLGARPRLEETTLQVTEKPHLGCKKFAARSGNSAMEWVSLMEHRAARLRGLYCEVIESGGDRRRHDQSALETTRRIAAWIFVENFYYHVDT